MSTNNQVAISKNSTLFYDDPSLVLSANTYNIVIYNGDGTGGELFLPKTTETPTGQSLIIQNIGTSNLILKTQDYDLIKFSNEPPALEYTIYVNTSISIICDTGAVLWIVFGQGEEPGAQPIFPILAKNLYVPAEALPNPIPPDVYDNVIYTGDIPITMNLPDSNISSDGSCLNFQNLSAFNLTIASFPGDKIQISAAGLLDTINLTPGENITINLNNNVTPHTWCMIDHSNVPDPLTISKMYLTATSNQLTLGSDKTITLSASTPVNNRVYTIPDTGSNAQFVMTYGNQNILDTKTFYALKFGNNVDGNAQNINNVAKIGVGITNPTYQVDVSGSVNVTGNYYINGVPIGGGGSSQWTTNGNKIYYNTGNVGIGTSNPISPLEVATSGQTYITITGADSQQQGLEFRDSSQKWVIYKPGNTTDLRFYDGENQDILTLRRNATSTFDGYLGINGTTPTAALDFGATVNDRIISLYKTGITGYYGFGISSGALRYNVQSTNDNHVFYAADNTELMRIRGNGYVGIGNSNPSNILQVGGGGRLLIANDATGYSLIGCDDIDSDTNTRIILSGSNRGIYSGGIEYVSVTGATSYSHKFYTNGNAQAMALNKVGSTYMMDVNGSVNLIAGSNYYIDGVPVSPWNANGNDIYYNAGNVNLGRNLFVENNIETNNTVVLAGNVIPNELLATNNLIGYENFSSSINPTGFDYTTINISNVGCGLNCMSGSGKYVSAIQGPSGIVFVSDDYGLTFTNTGEVPAISIDTTFSAKVQVMVSYVNNNIKISNDYGRTWTLLYQIDGANLIDVCISETGQYITTIPDGLATTTIYVSQNYGQTWAVKTLPITGPNYYTNYCDMSGTGKYQYAVKGAPTSSLPQGLGYIYRSSDYGTTWTENFGNSGARQWYGINVSQDGKYIIASAWFDGIYVSNNYGNTWVKTLSMNDAGRVALSSNGKVMFALGQNSARVFYSVDFGATWSQQYNIDAQPIDVALSYDGEYVSINCSNGTAKRLVFTRNYNFTSGHIDTSGSLNVNENAYIENNLATNELVLSGNMIPSELLTPANLMDFQGFQSLVYPQGFNYSSVVVSGAGGGLNCMSGSGKYVAVVSGNNGNVFTSDNYGNSFTIMDTIINSCKSVDCNFSGKMQVVVSGPYYSNGSVINISKDYGRTWTLLYPSHGTLSIGDVCISETGKYITAIPDSLNNAENNVVYVSQDYGDSWSIKNLTVVVPNISVYCDMSGTGKYQYVVKGRATVSSGYIYRSDDYGETWTENFGNAGAKQWYGVNVSQTGQYVIAAAWGEGVYVTTNFGASWSQTLSLGDAGRTGISSDGRIMCALGQNSARIFYSYDYGQTWSPQYNIAAQPIDVSLSYDGKYLNINCSDGTVKKVDFGKKYNFADSSLGIGTTNAAQKLDVRGNAIVGTGTESSIMLLGSSNYIANTSNPGIYHKQNVGLGLSSDYQMSFEVNGSSSVIEAMRITHEGFVGIGLTNPSSQLHISSSNNNTFFNIQGPANRQQVIQFVDSLSNRFAIYKPANSTDLRFFDGVSGDLMTLRTDKRVGIGTSDPASTLEVYSATDNNYITVNGPVNRQQGLELKDFNGQKWVIYKPANSTDLRFWDGENQDVITLKRNGNVGIGTTDPSQILQVGGGGRLRISNGDNDYTLIGTSDVDGSNNTRIFLGGATSFSPGVLAYIAVNTNNDSPSHRFYTKDGNLETMTIKTNGNIGILNNNPQYNLDITGSVNITGTYYVNGTPIGGGGSSQWTTSGNDIYYNTGDVLVGKNLDATGYVTTDTTLIVKDNIISPELLSTNNLLGLNNIDVSLLTYQSWNDANPIPGYTITNTLSGSGNSSLCCMSSSGKYVYTVTNNSIYKSSDYGDSFINLNVQSISVDCSATGQFVVAVFGDYAYKGYGNKIIYSSDYGVTWSDVFIPTVNIGINDVSINETGQHILALPYGNGTNYVYVSNNYGETWNTKTFTVTGQNKDSVFADMSYDGRIQYFVKISTGYIYKSVDYGNTWTELTSVGNKNWYGINISRTGKYVVASAWTEGVYLSSDFGATFALSIFINDAGRVGVSYDGKVMMALGQGTASIYVSTDYGATWSGQIGIGAQPIDIAFNYNGLYGFISCNNISKKFNYSLNYNFYHSRVGINQPDPICALQVYGNIYSSFYVFGISFEYNSDRRIKKDIETIPDNLSLERLRLIEPKQYNYIDESRNGSEKVIGFIAQEVAEQLPGAVDKNINYIPNIYKNYQFIKINDTEILVTNIIADIQQGDYVRLTIDKEYTSTVTKIENNNVIFKLQYTKQLNIESGDVFIYGKRVNDFNYLKKDMLFAINFSATQELDRIITWHTKEQDQTSNGTAQISYGGSLLKRIKDLEAENTQLKSQMSAMQTQIDNILARLS